METAGTCILKPIHMPTKL